MSRLRISTKDSNRALSLREYLSQHGLNVVMLSSTKLEIETGDLSEELRNEISSWQHTHDLEVTVDALPETTAGASEPNGQSDAELEDFDVPQREFILAPHWRKAKAKAAVLGVVLAARREQARMGMGQISKWLHETEENILVRSRKGEEERKIAEENAWAESVRPIESVHREEDPHSAAIRVRERIQSALDSLAAFNSRIRLKDGGKAVAFAGGVVMAGLIGIGLSVSHVDKSSAATIHSNAESSSVPGATVQTIAQPQHPSSRVAPTLKPAVHPSKPSPMISARIARKQPRSDEVVTHHYQDEAEENGPEVVTHYYRQKAVSQLRKPAASVKHYSDMD
jgi:hypothetical protein